MNYNYFYDYKQTKRRIKIILTDFEMSVAVFYIELEKLQVFKSFYTIPFLYNNWFLNGVWNLSAKVIQDLNI